MVTHTTTPQSHKKCILGAVQRHNYAIFKRRAMMQPPISWHRKEFGWTCTSSLHRTPVGRIFAQSIGDSYPSVRALVGARPESPAPDPVGTEGTRQPTQTRSRLMET